jgi:5,10-methylenetetrahydromethanopterin reductase
MADGNTAWRTVQRAEALGFSHARLVDTQLLCAELFASMAVAAVHTERIRLGIGVLVPSNRIPPVTANGLATLNKLAPGRVDFGVGTGFTARNTMGLGAMRLADLREHVRVVRGLFRAREHEVPAVELEVTRVADDAEIRVGKGGGSINGIRTRVLALKGR